MAPSLVSRAFNSSAPNAKLICVLSLIPISLGVVPTAATTKPIKLHAKVQKALQTPEVRERLRYEKLVREAGIKPD